MANSCNQAEACCSSVSTQESVESVVAEPPKSPPLSKRKAKRLARIQRTIDARPAKRKLQRERKKRKRAEEKLNNVPEGEKELSRKRLKLKKMANSPCQIKVAIDMQFQNLMTDGDLKHTLKQVQYCYGTNRRSLAPLQLYVTSFHGQSEEILSSWTTVSSWDVNFHTESYDQLFPKDSIVYLSSESENILTELDQSKAYIIGGIVDHNSRKGLCHEIAQNAGVAHARLPIDEYVTMSGRRVLAINHVFEILLKFIETKSWETAFFHVIPGRKNVTPVANPDS